MKRFKQSAPTLRWIILLSLPILLCMSLPLFWRILKSNYLHDMWKPVLRPLFQEVMQNKYPGAHFLSASGYVSNAHAGDSQLISVIVRFETRDRFDTVYSWFKAHPGNIHAGEVPFPEMGLSEVEITGSGNTVFEVVNNEYSFLCDDIHGTILSRLLIGEISFGKKEP